MVTDSEDSIIYKDVYSYLETDICDIGFFIQMVQYQSDGSIGIIDRSKEVLSYLLDHGVEIGQTSRVIGSEYIKFIAWKGTTEERIKRAFDIYNSEVGIDRVFSSWLCLTRNTDKFEDQKGQ